ncbi:hypothetical protein F5B18DRAFT_548427 [Nemania serpens]|nr:hypothetical protein F5B18DRAFT_548427 [Nemania serpens]
MRLLYNALVWALVIQSSLAFPKLSPAGSGVDTGVHANTNVNASFGNRNDSAVMPQWLEAGDPCSGMGTDSFELGKEYREADCPAINQLLEDGMCDWTTKQSDQTKCAYFCQIRTTFFPAEEVPIPNTYCRGPRRCSIPSGRTLQVDSWWSGTEAAASALKHGISGGFNPGLHSAVAGPGDVTIGEGECGYFTWIGTRKEVCGSLSQATRHEAVLNGLPYCQHPADTTANFCVDEIYSGALRDVSTYGHTVFVKVDCVTRHALPAESQDPLFKFSGVALEDARLDEVLQGWVTTTCRTKDNFLWTSFTIHGRGLRDADLGSSGIHLLEKMRSCHAAVTGWTFDYTPDDNDYDWRATGAVDPFDFKCPGDALLAVGANYRDGC